MGIYTTLPEELREVDVIIVGGGATGCVVASRLADADPELSILVIERGKNNFRAPAVNNPVLWRDNYYPQYFPNDQRVSFHKAVKEEQLGDRESIVVVANTLGGGSSINLMMYTRAQRCDYDSWNTEGWSTEDLLPYLRRFETYHGQSGKDYHGYQGPIHVSDGPFRSMKAEDEFVAAMEEVGFPEAEDLQDFESVGVARGRKYVSPEGQRQDVAHTYLHPRLQDGKHPNLHVLVESQVLKVLFEDGRACGVEYRANPIMQSEPSGGVVKAKKLVVLSCGALGSPAILERSSIGDADVLRRAGVGETPIVNLPGVGHDYQDHNMSIYGYKSDLTPDATTDAIHAGQADVTTLLESKDKILGWNGIDAWSKLRPTSAEIDTLGPAFRNAWDKDFKDPSKPLIAGMLITGLLGDRSLAPPGQYFCMGFYTAYPYSRGYVHITGPGIDDPLEFKTGYLTDKHDLDLKAQIWAYKTQREVARRMSVYQGELPHMHPEFPPGSKASLVSGAPEKGSGGKESIEYSAEDDAAIEKWIRKNMTTCWHGIGTCKMAPREQLGVVDKSLGVYGVSGLKVADLSIVPENVCANTMSTALAIGEKAADIFIGELGLGSQ
ncbi:putative alcohol oxidase [Hypomontagnella monticulosa]|nr:putative alcohol oxidase [Hypomontagnella monticulosa]